MRGRVALFGGTAEGRALALELCRRFPEGEVVASVVTGWGRELLEAERPGNLRVRAGRMDKGEMADFLRKETISAVIDATHPYAKEVTENLRAACGETGIPFLPLLRAETPIEAGADILPAESIEEAARLCERLPGNILLTTGAKELPAFCRKEEIAARTFPRVLPLAESLEQCRRAGIPAGRIIAMQGPFSHRLNLALMEQLSVAVLVTKDGGETGGMPEKLSAAREHGAKVVVIRRPPAGEGMSREAIISFFEKEELL